MTRARWIVRAVLGCALVAGIATLAGCADPTGPSAVPPTLPTTATQLADPPAYVAEHGRTVGIPNGGIAWLCRTQLRSYYGPQGIEWVIDWYVQGEPCPVQPIE